MSIRAAAKRFGIGSASLIRWISRVEAKRTRYKMATKINMEMLAQDVLERPDAHYSEGAKKLGVSTSTVFYALKRLKITYKKNPLSSQSKSQHRKKFLKLIHRYKTREQTLVYLDESGFRIVHVLMAIA